MSDEPRRSVRSTKGIHSHKEQEIEGNIENLKKKVISKKGGNKKGASASKEPSPALEKNSDGDIIRCVCGAISQDDDDDGEEWIACEQCGTWQHNVCMGIATENVDQLPDYYCEVCRPENHEELLTAKNRGEKLWEERRKAFEAGKKARRNRKSKGGSAKKKKADPKPAAHRANGLIHESPAPSGHDGISSAKKDNVNKSSTAKRKSRDESQDQDSGKIKQRKVSTTPATPATPATGVSQTVFATPAPPPPVAPLTVHPLPNYITPSDLPNSIDDLNDDTRKNIAKFINVRMEGAVKIAADNGLFTATPDTSIEQKAQRLTLELERAIHDSAPNLDSYSKQATLVGRNIRINQELCDHLLSRELSIGQLAGMSEDDMKSSELRQRDEEDAARAERQSTMVTADVGPRIRRTHKGEELVEDGFGANSELHSREQRDSNTSSVRKSRQNTPDEIVEPPSEADYTARPKPPNIDTQTGSHERKQSVQDFDYNKVASKLPTPTHTQPNRRISGTIHIPREAVVDPDVDRLLEDGPESPPYSPKQDSDPSVVWTGQVVMPSIGTFNVNARHVGGVDLNGSNGPSYLELLGERVSVGGRIEPEKANEYLCGLRYSPASDMIVISVTPSGEASTKEFTNVFEYFVEKNRYGVVGARIGPSQVRDIYLVPIEDGKDGLPLFMSNIDVNKLPEKRIERSMLIVIVYRSEIQADPSGNGDGNQSPSLIAHPQRQMSLASGPEMSPLAHQGSFKSPIESTQQQLMEAQHRGEVLAHNILGPELMRSPTVAFILPQAHKMVDKEWNVIKDIFMNDAKARTDLQHLGQLLADRANQSDQQQQRGDGISPVHT